MTGLSKARLDDVRTKCVENPIIGGVITSGAALSAVRQLAGLDFRLFARKNYCVGYYKESHSKSCEKVLFQSKSEPLRART
jgi:hypothetical protein